MPGTRTQIGVRVGADVKRMLDDAMKRSGRTQSQEAELRLEVSLRDEALLDSALELYGHGVGDLLRVLGTAMRNAGRRAAWAATGSFDAIDDWLHDPFARNQAIDAATTLLEGLRPKQEDRLYRQPRRATLLGFTPEVVGQNAAVGALLAIKDPDGVNDGLPVEEQNAEREAFGRRFHLSLGPLVEEIPALARWVTSEEQA
jgi:hypothetical protein